LGLPGCISTICIFLNNRWASFFLQDTHLVIPFDQTLPDHVYEAMYMVEARLAMGELVRYLDEVEKIAKRTRGKFYLKNIG
jgi:hypothetical protein